jgi:hypothetical protein
VRARWFSTSSYRQVVRRTKARKQTEAEAKCVRRGERGTYEKRRRENYLERRQYGTVRLVTEYENIRNTILTTE